MRRRKLSTTQITEIKGKRKRGVSVQALAEEYGVSKHTILARARTPNKPEPSSGRPKKSNNKSKIADYEERLRLAMDAERKRSERQLELMAKQREARLRRDAEKQGETV